MDKVEDINSEELVINNKIDIKCAPGVKFIHGSCINLNLLLEMAKAYNIEHTGAPIKLYPSYDTLNPGKYKKYLLKSFKDKLSKCKTQQCWTEQSFVDNLNEKVQQELQKYTFRPEGPEGKFEWLNTINIDDVMEQYEKQYKDFKFLGGVPIDFDELPVLGIKDLDFNQLIKEGKTKIGAIFNLDEHYKPGSHWVAMFSNLKEGKIYYFDSYGVRPEMRIRKLLRRVAKFCQSGLGVSVSADYNKLRHQYDGSECGVYSIYFLLKMLRGDPFESITTSRISDETVNKCRNVYFRNVDFK